MDALTNTIAISCAILVVLYTWKIVNMVWLRPKKLEKFLQNQGFNGNKYKFLFGDIKELSTTFQQSISSSKNINIDDGDEVLSHVAAFGLKSLEKHGRSCMIWMGWKPAVTNMDPEFIKDVLTNSNDFQKAIVNPFLVFIASGLVSLEGDQWVKHRKLMNPAFHVEKLKNMVPAFHLSCREIIAKWENLVWSNGTCEIDVWPYLIVLTSDVISRTAFGSSFEDGIHIFKLIREQSKLALEATRSLYIPGSRFLPTKRNRRMKAIDKEVTMSIRSVIDKKLKAMKGGEGNHHDLLGIMLESSMKEVEQCQNTSHGMTIDEITEECKLFYFAGHETTSTLLVWTMILLSRHQEWQIRAREEVLNVIGDKDIDINGLNKLKVVNMILYEVLRLYPPIPGTGRVVKKDTKLGKFSLPSGIQIALPIMLIHYDEQLWGNDAKKFNPDRFSEGIAKATKNQVIYFPFGWGPRICIGQNFALLEAKTALAMILQRFSFELSPSYVHSPNLVLTLQPKYGAHLILKKL